MERPISVTYKSTNKVLEANRFLHEISKTDLFAADFEVAVKYTTDDLTHYKELLETDLPRKERITLESRLKATALDHPSHTQLTHCSIALNDHEGYVFILDNPKITKRILNFLTTTPVRQVWHNASFDFKHLQFHTGKFPLLYEDTQILAKTILNHADITQAKTGLKQLAGHKYGAWGISADNFTIEQMYDPQMLLYSTTDACATYWLWNSIQRYLKETNVTSS